MAIIPPSNTQSLNGVVWARLQQQQAQRTADQAEQSARSLQVKARAAEGEAVRAQENARTVKVEYSQAEDRLGSAKRNLTSLKSLGLLDNGLQAVRERIVSSTMSPESGSRFVSGEISASVGVLNAQGQQTGSLVNVTA